MKHNRTLFMLALCAALCACAKPIPSQNEFVLGTLCTVTLYEKGRTAIYQRIFSRFREIEDTMSANRSNTELAAINQNAGIAPVAVQDDLFAVIESALHYAELSGGAFDPSIGPLVKLWNIGFDASRVPEQEEIDAALPLVNWRRVLLDQENKTVFLTEAGMQLDLGGIAKGYAADEAVRIIRSSGIVRAIVNLGGNVYAYGIKADKSPWKVGVQDPLDDRDSSLGFMTAFDKTLVTSGVYERFFVEDGKQYHHILSPKTGYPAQTNLLSVTVIAERSIDADALSTCIFALGYKEGLALIEKLAGVEAIFVFEDGTIRGTKEALQNFTLTNTESFTVVDEQ
jgi:thiamine biosynthesis lipoprotein